MKIQGQELDDNVKSGVGGMHVCAIMCMRTTRAVP